MAGASPKSGFCRRKTRVRKFDKSFELIEDFSLKGLKILKALGAENSQVQAAKMAECSESTVSYWKDKLVAMGALRFQCRSASSVFSLTPYGSKVVTRSEGFVSETVCLEDFAWKFGVVEWEKRRLDWRKLGNPRNWEKLGVRIASVRVVRTSCSVIIHPGKFKGWDERELRDLAVRTVEWVKRILEDKFGMVLEPVGCKLHEPIFRFYSQEAREDVKYGTVITEGVGSTDNSPPERVPHEEYSGVERAHARHLLPDSVSRLERKVDVLAESTEKLVCCVGKLSDTLNKLLTPEGPDFRGNGLDRSKEHDYVS